MSLSFCSSSAPFSSSHAHRHRSLPLQVGAEVYIESKRRFAKAVSADMRHKFGATWCVAESGTCGPDFYIPGVVGGFTAVGVTGPDGFSRVRVVHTGHGERVRNMSTFGEAALELLVEALEETQPAVKVVQPEPTAAAADVPSKSKL